jgi:hypothetical protein
MALKLAADDSGIEYLTVQADQNILLRRQDTRRGPCYQGLIHLFFPLGSYFYEFI